MEIAAAGDDDEGLPDLLREDREVVGGEAGDEVVGGEGDEVVGDGMQIDGLDGALAPFASSASGGRLVARWENQQKRWTVPFV